MTKFENDEVHLRILDELEREESEVIVWGDTGGGFSRDELLQRILTSCPELDEEEVLDEMLERALLFEERSLQGNSVIYRTRMGQSVHLLRSLRQWFPGQRLEQTRSLVSDFRFHLQPRRFPLRDLTADALFSNYLDDLRLDAIAKKAISAQIEGVQLSAFQARATRRILQNFPMQKADPSPPSGTIVCAGTGSGKTLSFYLPTLSAVAAEVAQSPVPRVRVLAIYPRKELLKDQFNETFQQCRKLDRLVTGSAGRRLRIGAFFQDTAHSSSYAFPDQSQSRPIEVLRCSNTECHGRMLWHLPVARENKEILRCDACGFETNDGDIAITRVSMESQPPDILFTTTEMLNQQMSNPARRKTFGITKDTPVPLVLLDEVHTYSGNQGAQVAFLLRRWARLAWARPHFVGLSATLLDAESYFSRLIGIPRSSVQEVEPTEPEMTDEGSEYLMMLRGDPVSQTALLSTTIQAAMLMRRVLDKLGDDVSEGVWGSRSFLFTDNLDVVNRLFWQLLDAEGWMIRRGRLEPNKVGPLALLRNPDHPGQKHDFASLVREGQDWSLAKNIGFQLDEQDRALVSRTSSQDAGVDEMSDLIVATASLEVGFNDPKVGAVIQHKAPKSMSAYLQRKGRAGRTRVMRPWMLMVLSDFGRDRVVFQHYEKFVSPEIQLQRLPLNNSHIHKMQAAMASLDWLGRRSGVSSWLVLNQPRKYTDQIIKLRKLVIQVMADPDAQSELVVHVQRSLQLDERQLERVLWQFPRSLFLEFLPTLRRRLCTNWARVGRGGTEVVEWAEMNRSWRSPVPEYIPDNLFSDLHLPGLRIVLERYDGREPGARDEQSMLYFQGLEEFAPGRVSKRFAIGSDLGAFWLAPAGYDELVADGSKGDPVPFQLEQAFGQEMISLGEIRFAEHEQEIAATLWQPYSMYCKPIVRQDKAISRVSERSNSFLQWQSLFVPPEQVVENEVPQNSLWKNHLKSVVFYSHASLTQLEVVRFARESHAQITVSCGRSVNRFREVFAWMDGGDPAAVGTRLWVDGSRFTFHLSDLQLDTWLKEDANLMHVLRAAYLQDQLREHPVFGGDKFEADWIWECFLAAIALQFCKGIDSIEVALHDCLLPNAEPPLKDIPALLFANGLMFGGDEEDDPEVESRPNLLGKLGNALSNPEILDALFDCGMSLCKTPSNLMGFSAWVRQILANTLAAGLQNTFCALLPNVDERAVVFDPKLEGEDVVLWVTELESGGSGAMALFQDRYLEDPMSVLNMFARMLDAGAYETLDEELLLTLKNMKGGELADAMTNLRFARTMAERKNADAALRQELAQLGIRCSHSYLSVLFSRVLRPGSDEHSDLRLLEYLERWIALERDAGFEVPLNIASLAIACQGKVPNSPGQISDRVSRIRSVLWPRGSVVRQSGTQFYNRFCGGNRRTERFIGAKMCEERVEVISVNDGDWLSDVHRFLVDHGRVDVRVNRQDLSLFRKVLALLQVRALDSMGLFFYPRVVSIDLKPDYILLRTEFAEFMH